MSEYQEQFSIEGLRRIQARLSKGDIRIERVEGDAVLVEASSGLQVERNGESLEIRRAHNEGERGRHRHRREREERGDLGTMITDVINEAMESAFGAGFPFGGEGADLRIGIPAVLERPRLEVQSGAGDISVQGVSADFALTSHRGDITIREAGGVLQAHTSMGELTIEGFAGPVTAHSGVGDVEVSDCPAGGAIHTGSGDMECERVSGAWKLHSGSGDVEVTVAGHASLAASTGSGDIDVRGGVLELLEVQTGSGDVECRSMLLGNRHKISTGNGDIELAIADPPGARLELKTSHGSIESAYPLVKVGKQGPQVHGGARYVGNIGDSNIDVELRTGSGDIEITRLDPDQEMRDAAARAPRPASSADPRNIRPPFGSSAGPRPPMPPAPPAPPMPPMPPAPPVGVSAAARRPPMPPMPPMPPAPPSAVSAQGGSTMEQAAENTADAQAGAKTEASPKDAATNAAGAQGANPRLAILESLGRGEISVEEAGRLLESLRSAS